MNVLECARRVKVLICDVDGVFTDGGLYFDAEGRTTKRFDVQDGLGINLARQAGLQIGVITGQNVPCVEQRMKGLGITEYHAGALVKSEALELLCKNLDLKPEEAAFLGDDWVDLGVMRRVGMPAAVANAREEVKAAALYVTHNPGGHGAVREFVEVILEAQGLKEKLLEHFKNS